MHVAGAVPGFPGTRCCLLSLHLDDRQPAKTQSWVSLCTCFPEGRLSALQPLPASGLQGSRRREHVKPCLPALLQAAQPACLRWDLLGSVPVMGPWWPHWYTKGLGHLRCLTWRCADMAPSVSVLHPWAATVDSDLVALTSINLPGKTLPLVTTVPFLCGFYPVFFQKVLPSQLWDEIRSIMLNMYKLQPICQLLLF